MVCKDSFGKRKTWNVVSIIMRGAGLSGGMSFYLFCARGLLSLGRNQKLMCTVVLDSVLRVLFEGWWMVGMIIISTLQPGKREREARRKMKEERVTGKEIARGINLRNGS